MKEFYINGRCLVNGRIEERTIVVQEGVVVDATIPEAGDEVIDLAGAVVVPGLVDVHVHLREQRCLWRELTMLP